MRQKISSYHCFKAMSSRHESYEPVRYVDSVKKPNALTQLILGVLVPVLYAFGLLVLEYAVFSFEFVVQMLRAFYNVLKRSIAALRGCNSVSELSQEIASQVNSSKEACSSKIRQTVGPSSTFTSKTASPPSSVAEYFEYADMGTSGEPRPGAFVPKAPNPLSPVSGKSRTATAFSSTSLAGGSRRSQRANRLARYLSQQAQLVLCRLASMYIAVRPLYSALLMVVKILSWPFAKSRKSKKCAVAVAPLLAQEETAAGPSHVVVVFGAASVEGEAAVRLHSFKLREVRSEVKPRRSRSVDTLNNTNLTGTGEDLLDSAVRVAVCGTKKAIQILNRCCSFCGIKMPLFGAPQPKYRIHTVVEPTGCMVIACDADAAALRLRYRGYPGVQCMPYFWGGRDDTARVKEAIAQSSRSLFAIVVIVPDSTAAPSQGVTRASSFAGAMTPTPHFSTRVTRLRGDVSLPLTARSTVSSAAGDAALATTLRSKASWAASGVGIIHRNMWATIPELDEFCSEDHLSSVVVPRILQPLRIAKDLLPLMIGCAQASITQYVTPPEWERLSYVERLILDALFDVISVKAESRYSDVDSDSSDSQSLGGCEQTSTRSSRGVRLHRASSPPPHLPHASGPKPRVVVVTTSSRPLYKAEPADNGSEPMSAATGGTTHRGFGAFVDISLMLAALNELQRSPYCRTGPAELISVCHVHCDHVSIELKPSQTRNLPSTVCPPSHSRGTPVGDIAHSIGMRSHLFQSILEAKDPRKALADVKRSVPKFKEDVGLHYDSPYEFSVSIPLVDFVLPPSVEAELNLQTVADSRSSTGRESSPPPKRPCPPLSIHGRPTKGLDPSALSCVDSSRLVLCRDRTSLDSLAAGVEQVVGARRWKLANQMQLHRARRAKLI